MRGTVSQRAQAGKKGLTPRALTVRLRTTDSTRQAYAAMARKTDTGKTPEIEPETGPEAGDETPRLAQFESSVAELEALVESLEGGDISLEDALTRFERGVVLARQCQTLLKNAELRVDQLLADGDNERVADFDTGDNPPNTPGNP